MLKNLLKNGNVLIVAIDPGTINLALSVLVARYIEDSKQAEYDTIQLVKYSKVFKFELCPVFITMMQVQTTTEVFEFTKKYLNLIKRNVVSCLNSDVIFPVLAIERFVYYGRKSIKHLETFNKIIGAFELAAFNFFHALNLQDYKVFEVTYKQWFSELVTQIDKLQQLALKQQNSKLYDELGFIKNRLNKGRLKKQKKDELLFKTLFTKTFASDNFRLAGDHIFDTYLLSAYALYRTF